LRAKREVLAIFQGSNLLQQRPAMINAVFFDLDGTLRHNLPSGGEVFAAYASQLGVHVRADDRLRAARWEHFYWANSFQLLEDRQKYDGDVKGFWDAYSRRQLVALGASGGQAAELAPQLNRYMMESYKPASVVPEDAPRVLALLAGYGWPMAVISNRTKPYQEEIEALGLSPYFAFSLAGGEVNAYKPGPEIFLQACKRWHVKPEHAAYVGDNYFADVVGARRAGMMPILYDPRRVFDEPDCVSIGSFDELPSALGLTVPEKRH
jgi:putative hydrolase of the HAD superfamily